MPALENENEPDASMGIRNPREKRPALSHRGFDPVLQAYNIDGDVRIQYHDQEDFERIEAKFGILEEWKAECQELVKHNWDTEGSFMVERALQIAEATPFIAGLAVATVAYAGKYIE